MTWNTSSGERILKGKEALLFAFAIKHIIDLSSKHKDILTDVGKKFRGRFSKLTKRQQFTVLEDIARCLLIESSSCVELTALNESAVYFIYYWIIRGFTDDVHLGIELWGNYVVDAYNECFQPSYTSSDDYGDIPTEVPPTLENTIKSVWIDAIEALADRILWDRDFEWENLNLTHEQLKSLQTDKEYLKCNKVQASTGAKERLYDLCNQVLYPNNNSTSSMEINVVSMMIESSNGVSHQDIINNDSVISNIESKSDFIASKNIKG